MSTSHDTERFEALAIEREKRGLTQEHIAEQTQIPIAHVQGLECGDFSNIPAGPYLEAYYRSYCTVLGLKAMSPNKRRGAPSKMEKPLIPLSVVRFVALVSVGGLLAWVGVQTFGVNPTIEQQRQRAAEKSAMSILDQTVTLHVRKRGHFKVAIDDTWVLDGVLEEGFRTTYSAANQIEVILPGAGFARLEYNGMAVVPQGRQDRPRRLTFVDDVGGSADE